MRMRREGWGDLACIVKKNGIVYTGFVGKPGEKRPLGGPRRGWKDNITIDIKGIWRKGVEWTDVAQDRNRWWAAVNTVRKVC
jgi:hypothetical protein